MPAPQAAFDAMKGGKDTELPFQLTNKAERVKYRARFAQPAYNTFLRFVIQKFGTARFAGVMKAFDVNPQLVVRVQ
jgi:hypothetical protein